MASTLQDLRAALLQAGPSDAAGDGAPPGIVDRLLGSPTTHTAALRWLCLWHLSRGDVDRARDAAGRLQRLAPRSVVGQALGRATALAAGVAPARLQALTRAVLEGPLQGLETLLLVELLLARSQADLARSLLAMLGRPTMPYVASLIGRVLEASGGRPCGVVEATARGGLSGWVIGLRGAGGDCRIVVRQGDRSVVVPIRAEKQPGRDAPIRCDAFDVDASRLHAGEPVRVVVVDATGEGELFGSPLRVAAAPSAIEGEVWCVRQGVVKGWAYDPAHPSRRARVVVRDDAGRDVTAEADLASPSLTKAGIGDGRHAFIAVLPVDPARRSVQVTHAGTSIAFAGSPFLDVAGSAAISAPGAADAAGRTPVARPFVGDEPVALPRRRRTALSPMVDVIVPAYRGTSETLACLASVLESACRQKTRVVVVDDCSPEPELSQALRALAASGRIELLANAENLGFVGSVNRAMALHPDRDAVILNSDTLVAPGWLDRLLGAARRDGAIGTVTPLSNNATICSYPHPDRPNPLPSPAELGAIDQACAASSPGVAIDLPTGVGFCLFVRRDCWAETGGFDVRRFGRGYGEENDFCLRARDRGWRNVVATDVYVAHRGGLSFGAETSPSVLRALRVLNQDYPGYDRMIADWIADDPLRLPRRRIDLERLAGSPGTRRFLMITADVIGGTERHVRHLADRLAGEGVDTIVLKPASGNGGTRRIALEAPLRGAFPNLVYDAEEEWPELLEDLRRLGISHIHLHHLLGLPDRVLELPRALGCPLDVTIHDYSWICKRINLIDETGRYCGEPALAVCDTCVRINGATIEEPASTAELRQRSARIFAGARAVFVPSEDAERRMARHFPETTFTVRRHEEPASGNVTVAAPRRDGVLKVAVIGAIGPHKGYDTLLACARDVARRDLPIEFRVIGYTIDDPPLIRTGRAWITGRFAEGELGRLIEAEGCHAAFLPSVWPETWCYALGSALRAGLTPFVFNLGAMPDRLKRAGVGVCLPLDSRPEAINDRLVAFRNAKVRPRIIDLTDGPVPRILVDYYGLTPGTAAARRKSRKADRPILESAR